MTVFCLKNKCLSVFLFCFFFFFCMNETHCTGWNRELCIQMLGGSLIWCISCLCWPTGLDAFTICCPSRKAFSRIGLILIRKVISQRWPANISDLSTGLLWHSQLSAIFPLQRPTQSEYKYWFLQIYNIRNFFRFSLFCSILEKKHRLFKNLINNRCEFLFENSFFSLKKHKKEITLLWSWTEYGIP